MNKVKNMLSHLLNIKLREKLFLVYLVFGVIPFVSVIVYLNVGTRNILIEQNKESEYIELNLIAENLHDNMRVLTDVSKRFYFDENLEHIAFTEYKKYADVVDDYKNYAPFPNYLRYYYQEISQISMYMKNNTLSNTAVFIVANEEVTEKDWYQQTMIENGRVIWSQYWHPTQLKTQLRLTRLVRTKQNKEVGVLSISMQNKRSELQISNRSTLTLLVLGEEELVHSNGGSSFDYEVLREEVKKSKETGTRKIRYQDEECFMTVVQMKAPESISSFKVVSIVPNREILATVTERSRSGTVLLVLSVIVSIAMISIYSQTFSKRIYRFKKQMHFAATGNFNIAKAIGGHDEISELYDDLNSMIECIRELLDKVVDEQLQKEQLNSRQKDVEFKMLASQINPHFLYNTLETIRMKARCNHQEEIEELVKMLAKIMRRNIQVADHLVTFKSELELVEYYLKIQSYRFGDRIKYQIDLRYDISEDKLMPLIIQPIVENAFVHGLETKDSSGLLQIIVEKTDRCRIYIIDNGVGIEKEKLESILRGLNDFNDLDRTHIGLSNVNQRIKLLYGEEYGILIESVWNEGTTVIIELPKEIGRE